MSVSRRFGPFRRLPRASLVAAAALFALTAPRAEAREPPRSPRPNIVWIVVDTLRADRLPFYGGERENAPRIDALLARRGARFETAYAQAPWTSPSVASYLTGLDPAALRDPAGNVTGIPRGQPTVASRLGELGYETAAFAANPLVSATSGFAFGFERFWTAPGGMDAMLLHADSLQAELTAYLRAREDDRPLLLYVHYVDPHEPYAPPGQSAPPIPAGRVARAPSAEILAAYDAEVRYVDRFVGELVETARTKLGPNTLFLFHADHGEELFDHGELGHATTLYDEVVRVPLVVRWDGKIAPGRSIGGTVRLLDLAPTIFAAAGAETPESSKRAGPRAGVNLLPVLRDPNSDPPVRLALVRSWQRSPLRLAAIGRGSAVLLHNHREPLVEGLALHRVRQLERMRSQPRVERFDLVLDPTQRSPLTGPLNEEERRRVEALYAQLDETLDGVRVLVRDLPPGTAVEGWLRFGSAPTGVGPLFLDDADQVSLAGDELHFRFVADEIPKGVLVGGRDLSLVSFALRVEGGPHTLIETWTGEQGRYGGGPIASGRLVSHRFPAPSGRPELRIWSRRLPSLAASGTRVEDAESAATLRALGYID